MLDVKVLKYTLSHCGYCVDSADIMFSLFCTNCSQTSMTDKKITNTAQNTYTYTHRHLKLQTQFHTPTYGYNHGGSEEDLISVTHRQTSS